MVLYRNLLLTLRCLDCTLLRLYYLLEDSTPLPFPLKIQYVAIVLSGASYAVLTKRILNLILTFLDFSTFNRYKY